MQPWAAAQYQSIRRGITNPVQQPPDEFDPWLNCFPPGVTRMLIFPRPFEIRQLPDVLLMLFETDHWVRRVYLDGRGHPDGYPITWLGHSTGEWNGDSLIVDTVGINDKTWIDNLGHPHTDALHLLERYQRVRQDTLEVQFTIDDPKAYTRPWTGKKVYQLMPPGYEVMEHVICEEHLELGKKR